MWKTYGYGSFDLLQILVYQLLGDLLEPKFTHRCCRRTLNQKSRGTVVKDNDILKHCIYVFAIVIGQQEQECLRNSCLLVFRSTARMISAVTTFRAFRRQSMTTSGDPGVDIPLLG